MIGTKQCQVKRLLPMGNGATLSSFLSNVLSFAGCIACFAVILWAPSITFLKGNSALADLKYGIISPVTPIFAVKKGYLGKYTFNIPPHVL